MNEKPALNPSPEFVVQHYRATLLGALLRSQLNLYQAKRLTSDLLGGMLWRLRYRTYPQDANYWLQRLVLKRCGRRFYPLDLKKDEALGLLYAVSHPALTPLSQSLLCVHLLGGVSMADLPVQATYRWKRALNSALRAVNFSINTDIYSWEDRLGNRSSAMLRTLLKSYKISIQFSLPALRSYLEGLLPRLQPYLKNSAEGTALAAWFSFQRARGYAHIFANDLKNERRDLWDQEEIQRGEKLLEEAQASGVDGPVWLQAKIMSLHLGAVSYVETPWPEILSLYLANFQYDHSTEQLLGYVEALTFSQGPARGLEYMSCQSVEEDHRWIQVRAQLLSQLGRKKEALLSYQNALVLASERHRPQILADMAYCAADYHEA